ncbi:MAG: aspartyl protease family protein [Terriglobales bacterium]
MLRKLRCLFLLTLTSSPCFAQSSNSQPAASASPPTTAAIPSSSQPAQNSSAGSSSSAPSGASAPPLPDPLGDAMALYRKRDFEGALAKYREILQRNPKSPDAFAGIVRVYLKQKKVDEAAHAADQGLALSDAPRIRVAHAEVLFRQGKIEEAEKEWVNIINSGHPEARAYLGLSRVRHAVAMYKSSQIAIKKAHELDPGDPDIEERWVTTLSRSERIKYLEDSLAADNNWDDERRFSTAHYLEYLKERAKKKDHPCRLVSKVTATETPLVRLLLDPRHLRGFGLTVELNGHKSSLMLDTGASGILVRRGIAEKAGISKVTETRIGGIGDKGRKNGYLGMADSIKIGGLEFQNCPVEVIEGRSVGDEDGLIGADVFDDFLVDLDFPDEKLKLSELPKRPGAPQQELTLKDEEGDSDSEADDPSHEASSADAKNAPPRSSGPQDRYIAPEMHSYTPIFLFGHNVLVPTKIGDVPYKLFLLDSGAFRNSISPAAAREVTKVGIDPNMHVKGVSGSVNKVFNANKATFTFGHLRQENQDIVAFDTTSISDSIGTEVSGFLGFTMLRLLDIKIDYRDALVDFSYDPSHWRF